MGRQACWKELTNDESLGIGFGQELRSTDWADQTDRPAVSSRGCQMACGSGSARQRRRVLEVSQPLPFSARVGTFEPNPNRRSHRQTRRARKKRKSKDHLPPSEIGDDVIPRLAGSRKSKLDNILFFTARHFDTCN